MVNDEWITPPADHPADDGWMTPPKDHPVAPKQYGPWESAGEGALSGLTANWSDELRAIDEASGLKTQGPERSLVGAAKLAYEHFTGQPGEASAAYEKAVKEFRDRQKAMKEQHPYAYGAGEIGGSVAPMLAMPLGGGATVAARAAQAAKAGAAYGAVSGAGEGEGLADTAANTGIGGVIGAIGGAAAVPAGEAVAKLSKAIYDKTLAPAVSVLRGWSNPEAEAGRRVAGAIVKDAPQVAAGTGQGLTPAAYTQAKAAGEPVMNVDLGGASTKALLRSAANTSPEGRDIATSAIEQRFHTQSERGGAAIRDLVAGGANSMRTRAQLQAEYDVERGAAYDAAYAAGDRPLRSPVLERLMGSRSVIAAMKDAVEKGSDRAVAQGQGAFRTAAEVTPDGRLVFRKGPNGVPTYPNLQFWDQTYRHLRDAGSAAFRAGRNEEGGAINTLAQTLKGELDKKVPEFAKARGVAATYFGGNDAIEAGQKAVNFKGNVGQLKLAIAKMKPAERDLFQEAYADAWATKIESMANNRDIGAGTALANSVNDRKKVEAVFGPQGAAKVQAFADREKIFDAARKVLGNSTTARQLIEAGLAGGAGGAIGSYFDGSQGGVGGFLTGAALHHAPRAMVRSGTEKLVGYVDKNVAKKVAEYLTSDDPAVLQKGLNLIAGNRRLQQGMTAIRDRISAAAGASQAPGRLRLTVGPHIPATSDQGNTQTAERARGGRITAHQAAVTRKESHYSAKAGTAERHCGGCAHFVKPNACTKVGGHIAAKGLCDWFKAKEETKLEEATKAA